MIGAPKLAGYWSAGLIPIFNGTAPIESENFQLYSEKLLDFRKLNPVALPDELQPEQLAQTTKQFYESYCKITKITDLSKRVSVLSKTTFMKAICTFDPQKFDKDEHRYMRSCALPGGVSKQEGGAEVLQNKRAKRLALQYHLAITSPEKIKANVKSYRGLTLAQMKGVSNMRGDASGWYDHFVGKKEGVVTRDDIVALKEALAKNAKVTLDDRQHAPLPAVGLNPIMALAYDKYVALALVFRTLDDIALARESKQAAAYRREESYWESIESNFSSFVASPA